MENFSGNRPAASRSMNDVEREHQVTSAQPQNGARRTAKKPAKLWWWIGIIIAVLLVGAIAWTVFVNRSQVDGSKYQAVFLNNGQVYFGKLHNYYTTNPYLTDVYYIQSQGDSTTSDKTNSATSTSNTLIKLGSEIHGPEDKMILNKASILFVENLTDNGKVVQAIKDGSATTGSNTQGQQNTTPQAPTSDGSKK